MPFTDVVLPNVVFVMEVGRILAWLKAPGDTVLKGEAVAEIEGDKATVELESTVDGVLADILVPADQMVVVGTVLARISRGATVSAQAPPAPSETSAPVSETIRADLPRVSPVAQRLAQEQGIDIASLVGSGPGGRITREDVEARMQRPASTNGGRVLAAPAVRRLARDQNIELASVIGTGPDGRRTRADVEKYIERTQTRPAVMPAASIAPPAPAPQSEREGSTLVPISQMRKVIARRLTQSMQDAPHFYTTAQLDLTAALERLPKGIGVNALLLYVTVQALQDIPVLNATFENDALYQYEHVNLSMAVALPDGLQAPVLQRADDYSLSGLAERAKDLISRARAGRLRQEEHGGGTFTLSNLGVVEQVERFTAILNPPQVGILAVGAAKERPLVINRGLHIRTTAYVTLSADHRVVDGMVAARFLEQLDSRLQAFAQSTAAS